MSHTVGEKAALAVKNSERRQAEAARTPEQRIADIRKNRAAKLFVTPDDQDFLLSQLDAALLAIIVAGALHAQDAQKIADLLALQEQMQAKITEFREVYEQENRKMDTVFGNAIPENLVEPMPAEPIYGGVSPTDAPKS